MEPSFFLTITTGEAQGLVDGLMTPSLIISFIWLCSWALTKGFCLRNGSHTGGPLVCISCSIRGVLLMGFPDLKNTSLYLRRSLCRSCFCPSDKESGTSGSISEEGAVATSTEYTVPIHQLVFNKISFSERLSSCMANFFPWLRVGIPSNPSGRSFPGSNSTGPLRAFSRKKT